LLFRRAKIISIHIMNNHAAMTRFAVVVGFFVAMSNPAKKD
jgi:hypothetical protein